MGKLGRGPIPREGSEGLVETRHRVRNRPDRAVGQLDLRSESIRRKRGRSGLDFAATGRVDRTRTILVLRTFGHARIHRGTTAARAGFHRLSQHRSRQKGERHQRNEETAELDRARSPAPGAGAAGGVSVVDSRLGWLDVHRLVPRPVPRACAGPATRPPAPGEPWQGVPRSPNAAKPIRSFR